MTAKVENSARITLFDRTLGWSYPPHLFFRDPAGKSYRHGSLGERVTVTTHAKDLIVTYGDSFTHCAQVDDDQTWQTFLASRLKKNVINFGVDGYGTDQAFLLFAGHEYSKAPIVMLCIFPENINRVVNYYRTFYTFNDPLSLTKPRFLFQDDCFKLLGNPLRSDEEIDRLSLPSFVHDLGSWDYWYQLDQRLPRIGFPYSYSVFQWRDVLTRSIKASLCRQFKGIVPPTFNQDLYQEAEPFSVMCHIVDEFVSLSHQRNQYPIVVIIPHTDYVREILETGASRTDPLLDYMKKRNYFFMDLVKAMADLTPTRDQLESWYQGHATAEGNQVTARLVSKSLDQRAEIDPTLQKILLAE